MQEQKFPIYYRIQECKYIEVCLYIGEEGHWQGGFVGIKCGNNVGFFDLEPLHNPNDVQARGLATTLLNFFPFEKSQLTLKKDTYISEKFKELVDNEINKRETKDSEEDSHN